MDAALNEFDAEVETQSTHRDMAQFKISLCLGVSDV